MYGKKLINSPQSCVQDMLDGIKISYPSLVVNSELGFSYLNLDRGNKVALLSGGGSGHEPFATGYVAHNMLTGAVAGLVFTSPPVSQVYAAIHHLSKLNKGGVLVIILNYTGDQLNFGIAIEKAKSKGIEVESISIKDDCALLEHDLVIGNRGICGCSFVFKLLGAMSDAGSSLRDIVNEYENMQERLVSMGACLYPCTLPSSQSPLFSLGSDEISLGCGVHGEAGVATVEMGSLNELVNKVLSAIWKSNILSFGEDMCVLVGNLGSSTLMECFITAKVVADQLREKGIKIERFYVGTLMSSLDMKGFQITLLNTSDRPSWLSCFDLPTEAFGWPGTQLSCPRRISVPELTEDPPKTITEQFSGMKLDVNKALQFKKCVVQACESLKMHTMSINELDSECGDGDCGSTLESLADGILNKKDTVPWNDVGQALAALAQIAEAHMGGTSGAVYSLLLEGAAKNAESWHSAWLGSLNTLYKYSPARIGHRTLVDALAPACEAYNSCILQKGEECWKEALQSAILKAEEGCQNTLNMIPMVGRATYAERSRVVSIDAGAYGVVVWLKSIGNALQDL